MRYRRSWRFLIRRSHRDDFVRDRLFALCGDRFELCFQRRTAEVGMQGGRQLQELDGPGLVAALEITTCQAEPRSIPARRTLAGGPFDFAPFRLRRDRRFAIGQR